MKGDRSVWRHDGISARRPRLELVPRWFWFPPILPSINTPSCCSHSPPPYLLLCAHPTPTPFLPTAFARRLMVRNRYRNGGLVWGMRGCITSARVQTQGGTTSRELCNFHSRTSRCLLNSGRRILETAAWSLWQRYSQSYDRGHAALITGLLRDACDLSAKSSLTLEAT